jgi:hypothetical protein
MARGTSKSNGGTSRVRFVMLDAEIAERDIAAVTQAIQNALRGPAPNTVKRLAAPASSQLNGSTDAATADLVDETETAGEEADAIDATQPPSRPKTARKPAPKPSVIDIDITSEPPLSSLVDPKSIIGATSPSQLGCMTIVISLPSRPTTSIPAIGTSVGRSIFSTLRSHFGS